MVLSHTRTRMIGDAGEPLVFDQQRDCYIDSYGGVQGAPDRAFAAGMVTGTYGDVMKPQLQNHRWSCRSGEPG